MTTLLPEVWLRGPIAGIHPLLQPAAHTLVQVGEDVVPIVEHLTLDRLLTYSRSAPLTPDQLAALASERTVHGQIVTITRIGQA